MPGALPPHPQKWPPCLSGGQRGLEEGLCCQVTKSLSCKNSRPPLHHKISPNCQHNVVTI